MPFALSFMVSPSGSWGSLLGRGTRTDLVVGTVATGLVLGRRLELPPSDAVGRLRDGLPRDHQILGGGLVTAGETGFQEAQLHARGKPAGHLVLGQRVDLQLETLLRALVRLLLVGDVARLVVDDDEPLRSLVPPVEASPPPVETEVESELALHLGGLLPGGFLIVIEAGERGHPGALALLLVLAGEEALVRPGVVEGGQEVLERAEIAGGAAAQVELHRLVQRAAVDHRVMLPERDAQDVDVLVLERARLVVVDLAMAERERRQL